MRELNIRTQAREQLLDITREIQAVVAESGLAEGVVVVYCPHTTAGITINENADPDVVRDILEGLGRLVPREAGWRHREGNTDGHIKALLVGSSVTVPVTRGRLALGTWQGIYFCEFDGPRSRTATITVLDAAR